MTNLIKKEENVFKGKDGFSYPFYWTQYETHAIAMDWNINMIPLKEDLNDFKKASQEDKEVIKNIMLLFTQNEVSVGGGYIKLLEVFKHTEVRAWLATALNREFTHINAYSKFTETLGLKDEVYTEFINIPLMRDKIEYVEHAKVKRFKDYQAVLTPKELDTKYRRDIAFMLAVYGGFTELVSLYAQFAMLMHFQEQNRFKGLCKIVEWSIRDEFHHGLTNSQLFKDFIKENLDIWDDELKSNIYEAGRRIVAYELELVDYINPTHINKDTLKDYIKYCANNALGHLALKPEYHEIVKNPLPFMDEITKDTMADFFTTVVTAYSNAVEGDFFELDFGLFNHIKS